MAGGTIEIGFLFSKIVTDDIIENIKSKIENTFSKIMYIDKSSKDYNYTMIIFCMKYNDLIKDNIKIEKEYIDELHKMEEKLILFVKKYINEYPVDYIFIDTNCSYNDKYLLKDVINENIYTIVCYYTNNKFNVRYAPWLLDGLRKRNNL